MLKFRFRRFRVYQDALKFRKDIKTLTKQYFPEGERYLLTDQITRAANSIVLNIAEGSDRSTDKDFANFLNKSHSSLNEVVSCLDLAVLDGYISDKIHLKRLRNSEKLANQLTAFRGKLLLVDNQP